MIKTTCNLDNVSDHVVMDIYSKNFSKITLSFIPSSESKNRKLVVLPLKELVVCATNFVQHTEVTVYSLEHIPDLKVEVFEETQSCENEQEQMFL
jgi:hypothetical protein